MRKFVIKRIIFRSLFEIGTDGGAETNKHHRLPRAIIKNILTIFFACKIILQVYVKKKLLTESI